MKWRLPVALAVISGACAACTGVLGLDTFSIDHVGSGDGGNAIDSGISDANAIDANANEDAQTCVDPTTQCYSCTPETDNEFLNSCTNGECQAFDRTRILSLLVDGGLPPLPDGG